MSVHLTPEGARLFTNAARAWVERRMAIVIDGRVISAPRILPGIVTGDIDISMSEGSLEHQIAEARDLADALGGE